MYQNAIYEPNQTTHKLEIKPLESTTPWIPVNPMYPDFNKFPRFAHANPITVTVNEGDMLYLPGNLLITFINFLLLIVYTLALWFHQVLQSGEEGVIAINYWYDMEYTNILYPTIALYRRLLTGVMEGNIDLLKDEETENSE